ncbi:hypothetical protein JCM10449v2_002960 [Rhodotorula kratochvilovae]
MLARTAAAVLAVLAGTVEAIVITQPSAVSVWIQTDESTARIEWSLLPETWPPPATQFFDIYIRNGVGEMYNPSLNVRAPLYSLPRTWLTSFRAQLLLASGVDSTATTFLNVADTEKFIPGPGYQLFFSDPANPATIYCDSDPFAIGSFIVNGDPAPPSSSSSSTAEASSSSSSAESSSSSCDSSLSSSSSTSTDSGMSTSFTSASSPSSSSSPSPTSSAASGGITAAPVPGGPDQQGFNLVPNGGARLPSAAAWAGAVLAAVAGAAALL